VNTRQIRAVLRPGYRALLGLVGAARRWRARRLLRRAPAPPPPTKSGYVLFFSPDAAIDPHLVALCVVGRTLRERGHDVLFVRCYDGFRRCPVMAPMPCVLRAADRERVCLGCAANSFRRLAAYDLPALDLREFVTPALRDEVARALAAAPADLREFTYDGVAFGKLSALDLILAHKVADLSVLTAEQQRHWREYVESSLTAYLVTGELCRRLPIRRVVVSADYSLFLGARLAAQKHGVGVLTATHASHRSVDRRKYVLVDRAVFFEFEAHTAAWPAWRERALPPDRVREVGEDTLVRFSATQAHVYSPPKTFGAGDLRTRLGLDPHRKLLVAFTSSLDEMMATGVTRAGLGASVPPPPQPFRDQIEWLQAVIDRVERSPNLQLVVRVHPREGPNKREGVTSQHLGLLRERFDRPFRHCRFVWPGDPVSSYDLGELADVALTSWSTIGLEFARMGVPVLTSTNGLAAFPHDDFLEWGPTPEAYFARLDDLLTRPVALDTLVRAFRWYNLHHLGSSLDLGDVVPEPYYEGLPPYRTPAEAATIEEVVFGERSVLAINSDRLRDGQAPAGAEAEREALRRHLRRLVRFLFTAEVATTDYPLVWADDENPPPPAGGAVLSPDGNGLRLTGWGRTWARVSPLCRRLAPLCAAGAAHRPQRGARETVSATEHP
jgi:hypothetical protein